LRDRLEAVINGELLKSGKNGQAPVETWSEGSDFDFHFKEASKQSEQEIHLSEEEQNEEEMASEEPQAWSSRKPNMMKTYRMVNKCKHRSLRAQGNKHD
jgi:hypothetical protein